MAVKKSNATPKASKTIYFQAVGRRKESSARVRLYLPEKKDMKVGGVVLEKGKFYVNGLEAESYFPAKRSVEMLKKPFALTDSIDRFAVIAKTIGGGKIGQLVALTLAIARALEKVNKDYRTLLKKEGLLTVDARARERRKVGMGGKSRRRRQSPKR